MNDLKQLLLILEFTYKKDYILFDIEKYFINIRYYLFKLIGVKYNKYNKYIGNEYYSKLINNIHYKIIMSNNLHFKSVGLYGKNISLFKLDNRNSNCSFSYYDMNVKDDVEYLINDLKNDKNFNTILRKIKTDKLLNG